MVYSVIGEGEYFECGVGGQNKEGKKKKGIRKVATRRSVGGKKADRSDITEIMEKVKASSTREKKNDTSTSDGRNQ